MHDEYRDDTWAWLGARNDPVNWASGEKGLHSRKMIARLVGRWQMTVRSKGVMYASAVGRWEEVTGRNAV
jgi:hypothetical protein